MAIISNVGAEKNPLMTAAELKKHFTRSVIIKNHTDGVILLVCEHDWDVGEFKCAVIGGDTNNTWAVGDMYYLQDDCEDQLSYFCEPVTLQYEKDE